MQPIRIINGGNPFLSSFVTDPQMISEMASSSNLSSRIHPFLCKCMLQPEIIRIRWPRFLARMISIVVVSISI